MGEYFSRFIYIATVVLGHFAEVTKMARDKILSGGKVLKPDIGILSNTESDFGGCGPIAEGRDVFISME